MKQQRIKANLKKRPVPCSTTSPCPSRSFNTTAVPTYYFSRKQPGNAKSEQQNKTGEITTSPSPSRPFNTTAVPTYYSSRTTRNAKSEQQNKRGEIETNQQEPQNTTSIAFGPRWVDGCCAKDCFLRRLAAFFGFLKAAELPSPLRVTFSGATRRTYGGLLQRSKLYGFFAGQ